MAFHIMIFFALYGKENWGESCLTDIKIMSQWLKNMIFNFFYWCEIWTGNVLDRFSQIHTNIKKKITSEFAKDI